MISYRLVGLVLIIDLLLQLLLRASNIGVANRGVALGVLGAINSNYLVLLVIVVLIWTVTRFREVGVIMILGGGLVNLVNRAVFGSVWDYLKIIVIWVNISDIVITIGLLLAIYESTRNRFSRS